MKKIPTLFVRDPEDRKHVLPIVTPGCEWVLAGEGIATRKYDGTCVMFDGEHWWARREVKPGKEPPPGWVEADHDDVTGKRMGWEPVEQSAFARWHAEAVASANEWDPEFIVPGTYELCGPKVNGDPESYGEHVLVAHHRAQQVPYAYPLDFEGLRERFTLGIPTWEGIVWHHPDGRMVKLKVRDFPAPTPEEE